MNITTVRKLANKHDGLSEHAIRIHIARSKTNGLEESGAIFRRGKRIFLLEEKYLSWLSGKPLDELFIVDTSQLRLDLK